MCIKTKIITRLKEDILSHELIEEGDTIIIGASGGPDSQFLIYSLSELRKDFDFDIVLVHLNHLHRKEAILDENLVIETAKKLSYSYYVERKSMDDFARKNKLSPEDAGRRLRYDLFRRVSKSYPKAKIALGHNKDDQAETVLMRIIRGTGLDGLKAMDYKSNDLIRPMLSFSKKEILRYLDEENISYHIDKTNLETDYTRNKLRLDIIPQLEKINPNFKDALVNLSLIARDDLTIIDTIEKKAFSDISRKKDKDFISLDKEAFEKFDHPLKNRLIRKSIGEIKGNLKNFSRANIEEFTSLTDKEVGKIVEKDDLVFEKNYRTYDLYKKDFYRDREDRKFLYLYENDQVDFGPYRLRTRILEKDQVKENKDKNRVFFDYDKLSFPLLVRKRKAGDRFTAFDNGSKKKLKDFFIDEKIDRKKRDAIALVLSSDKIIWIAPFRKSSDYKIDDRTKKVLMIELEEV